MCFIHPACLVISFVSAVLYDIYLKGKNAVAFSLKFVLPVMLLAMIANPAFSHEGLTILTYLPSGNPLTLESILYGVASAFMLGCVFLWFACYNEIMTSDKFIYLFGRIIPSLSLILSMTLRFIPKFKAQTKLVADAQRCMGRDVSKGHIIARTKNAMTILSIMITWSLENAIESADSMKSRGYGLPGRSAFSIYRFDERDKSMLIWLIFCAIYIFSGAMIGGLSFRYYPNIKGVEMTAFPISFMMCYLALCLTPLICNIKEDREWKRIQSAI